MERVGGRVSARAVRLRLNSDNCRDTLYGRRLQIRIDKEITVDHMLKQPLLRSIAILLALIAIIMPSPNADDHGHLIGQKTTVETGASSL